MRVLSQNLGLQRPRPSFLGLGQQMCAVSETGEASARSRDKPRGGRMRVWRREPGSGAEAGDPFLLILSPGIPGFGTGRLSLAGGGAQAGCMSWATSQEYTMFPSALAAALSGWPPPKPLQLQPPCPTFPGCLAPPSSSALTSPLPPAPSPPLTAAGPGYCGDCEAGQPGALRAGGGRRSTRLLCLCKIQTWSGGGRARAALVSGDSASIPEENGGRKKSPASGREWSEN